MDISEYDAMRKNEALLEKALERERQLHDENQKLMKEKNSALEDAKMKVVKIKRIEKHEHLWQKNDMGEAWRRLLLLLDRNYHNRDFLPPPPPQFSREALIDIFFNQSRFTRMEGEEVTTHGLDDVRAEIAEDLQKRLDDDTKQQLLRLKEVNKENAELVEKVMSLQRSLDDANYQLNNAMSTIELLQKENKELNDDNLRFANNERLMSNVKYALSRWQLNWFTFSKNIAVIETIKRFVKENEN